MTLSVGIVGLPNVGEARGSGEHQSTGKME